MKLEETIGLPERRVEIRFAFGEDGPPREKMVEGLYLDLS